MPTHLTRRTAVLLAAAAALLAGCDASSGTADRTDAASRATAPSGTVTTGGERPSSGAPTTGTSGASEVNGTGGQAPVTDDPARYHVGSFGPGSPRRYDTRTVSFSTPSGNIRCTSTSGDSVVCEIVRHTFSPAPRPSDCQNNWLGSDVSLDSTGARRGLCAGNPVVQQDSTALPYGHRLVLGSVTCASTAEALQCADSEHGFTLSRASVLVH